MKDKFYWSVTVGEKGQIVIPKQARDLFGINPGDQLLLLADTSRGLAIPPKESLDEINRIIFGSAEQKDETR